MSATFSNFGHKISLLASRDRTVSQDYIDVRGRSEESICQFLRNIAGDTHNLSVLRHYMVPHLPDKIHLRHLRDHTVLAHTSRLIKAEKIKIIVESNNPDMRSIFGFSVIRVSANLEERRQQEIELKQSRSMASNTKPATPEPLPPQSSEPAITPSQLVNPAPKPVATVAPVPVHEVVEPEKPVVSLTPAMLVAAAEQGIPFCEECARAAQAAAV